MTTLYIKIRLLLALPLLLTLSANKMRITFWTFTEPLYGGKELGVKLTFNSAQSQLGALFSILELKGYLGFDAWLINLKSIIFFLLSFMIDEGTPRMNEGMIICR